MNTESENFEYTDKEFGKLDILMIGDKPYFPATKCAKILGYKEPEKAIRTHCKKRGCLKWTGVSNTTNQYGKTTEQTVEMNYISEGNLYRLIVRSKLPSAEKFEEWVFDEVLPTIRKSGAYIDDVKKFVINHYWMFKDYEKLDIIDLLNTIDKDPEILNDLIKFIENHSLIPFNTAHFYLSPDPNKVFQSTPPNLVSAEEYDKEMKKRRELRGEVND